MTNLEVAGGIARLTLANPPVNAFSPALLDGIAGAIDSLERRDDWNVLVIASACGVFSAGGDLASMSGWMAAADPGRAIGDYAHRVQKLCARLENLPQLTVAECARSALGGGLELALACDLRIAGASAKFGLPEAGLGLLPGAGGTQRLTRLCGKATAMKLIMTAEPVDATTAQQLGLVQWVFEKDAFAERSTALLTRVAALPVNALRECKACITLADQGRHDEGFAREVSGIAELARSTSTRERVSDFLAGARVGAQGAKA